MKLFIIGNGFDLFHGFKTGYNHFKDYLKNYNCPFNDTFSLADFFLGENEDLWSDFENKLDRVSYAAIGARFSKNLTEDGNDKDWDYASKNNENLCDVFEIIVKDFKQNLCQAVSDFVTKAVEYNSLLKKAVFAKLFSENDLFISFNYTKTLEGIYGIKREQILYLHGVAYPNYMKKDDYYYEYNEPSIIFGHGNEQMENNTDDTVEADPFNPHEVLQQIPARLKKEYQKERLINFIKEKPAITELEIIGHGLGVVDQPYFLLLNNLVPSLKTIIYWYYPEDSESKEAKIKKLKSLFSGKIIIKKY